MEGIASRLFLGAAALAMAGPALAHGDDDDDRARARLSGYEEVPALSTTGRATFEAKVVDGTIAYTLRYRDLGSDAMQAHIHFGQKGVNGGIAAFLCSNLGNGPAGTQACPLRAGTVSGIVTADLVVGPAGQGIAPGEFAELTRALRSGVTYVNVHTTAFPGGEIRGQIKGDD